MPVRCLMFLFRFQKIHRAPGVQRRAAGENVLIEDNGLVVHGLSVVGVLLRPAPAAREVDAGQPVSVGREVLRAHTALIQPIYHPLVE